MKKNIKAKCRIILFIITIIFTSTSKYEIDPERVLSYIVDLEVDELKMFYKDLNNNRYENFGKLKESLEGNNKELIFATNGGMYLKDRTPQGLYIDKGQIITSVNIEDNNFGNFYLKPNGIFYITKDKTALVVSTEKFKGTQINYATQSGPMLLIDGLIHPAFNKGSSNMHIRNGVGILPDGRVLFAMSKEKINFYDFATYFKQMGCKNALYLDGFVSKTYLPSKNWIQLDGNFGVIIGVIKNNV